MSVREYIGARYVPLFMGEWDNAVNYEPLSIVSNLGNSYTSRQYVPAGTALTNETFWALTGNYNAQIEQYRQEVASMGNTIGQYAADIEANALAIQDEASAREAADTALGDRITELQSGSGSSIASLQQSIANERTARIQADAATDTNLANNYYDKTACDARFALKQIESDDILVCIGDSLLAGWSDENPSSIPAWDTYLAQALGYESSMVFKSGLGGAGFACGTTFAQQVATVKTAIETANKSADDVRLVVLGGGVNDIRNVTGNTPQRTGARDFINAACNAFPNAEIHIFAPLMGNKGCSVYVSDIERNVQNGYVDCQTAYKKRVVVHDGVWSWNYEGIDQGVSADGIHLLADGQKQTGAFMALEINGGSAYRETAWFNVTDINGVTIADGQRNGKMVSFKLSSNYSSTGASNMTFGVEQRYGFNDGCFTVSNENQDGNRIFFYHSATATWDSYTPISNAGCYGTVCYHINSVI